MAQNQNAFARSKNMFASIAAIMASGLNGFALNSKLSELGEYRSRGHGGRHRPNSAHKRFTGRGRGKYVPHTGAKQIAKQTGKLVRQSAPLRMWSCNVVRAFGKATFVSASTIKACKRLVLEEKRSSFFCLSRQHIYLS